MELTNDTKIYKGNSRWEGEIYRGDILIWPTTDEYETEYLTFEAVGSGSGTLQFFSASGFSEPLDIEFSKNDGEWIHYTSATTADRTAVQGDKFRVKGTNQTYSIAPTGTGVHTSRLWMKGIEFHIYGNIMSLIYGDDFVGKRTLTENNWNCFHSLLSNTSIDGSGSNVDNDCTDARNLCLPARTLSTGCYAGLLDRTYITVAPILPARTLADSCYSQMFDDCSNLVSAPSLPATTLTHRCYQVMFEGCTSLIVPPSLPATTLASYCYYEMFRGCTSLAAAPALPVTTLEEGCYSYMFRGCTSLATAPDLPANVLRTRSYFGMFNGCSSLNRIKCMATSFGTNSTLHWMDGVASSGIFIKHPDADWTNLPTGNNGIPSGWTVQNAPIT